MNCADQTDWGLSSSQIKTSSDGLAADLEANAKTSFDAKLTSFVVSDLDGSRNHWSLRVAWWLHPRPHMDPIEKVERSLMIVATTVHRRPASELLADDQRERFLTFSPRLGPAKDDTKT